MAASRSFLVIERRSLSPCRAARAPAPVRTGKRVWVRRREIDSRTTVRSPIAPRCVTLKPLLVDLPMPPRRITRS